MKKLGFQAFILHSFHNPGGWDSGAPGDQARRQTGRGRRQEGDGAPEELAARRPRQEGPRALQAQQVSFLVQIEWLERVE